MIAMQPNPSGPKSPQQLHWEKARVPSNVDRLNFLVILYSTLYHKTLCSRQLLASPGQKFRMFSKAVEGELKILEHWTIL